MNSVSLTLLLSFAAELRRFNELPLTLTVLIVNTYSHARSGTDAGPGTGSLSLRPQDQFASYLKRAAAGGAQTDSTDTVSWSGAASAACALRYAGNIVKG